jgi:Tfp pilus assembly protein PilF
MKTLLLSLLLLGHVNAYCDDTPTNSEPSSAERMGVARVAIQAKNWSTAITELKATVKEEPSNADAHNLLAFSFRKQAKPDLPQAFEHYRIALKLNPNHKGAHEYIGEAYLMDKKPAEAKKHLTELQRICGNTTCEEYVDLASAIAKYKQQK